MPYAIEMFFDGSGDSQVRALWDDFASLGASFMRDSGARPHVSLAVCDSLDLPATRQLLDRFAGATPSFAITFSSLGFFPTTKPVAFLALKVSLELLALQERFFSEFSVVAHDCWPHYSPRQWVPHCTLAMNFPGQQLGRALDVCAAGVLPLTCTVSEIGLVEFRPVKELYATALAKKRNG